MWFEFFCCVCCVVEQEDVCYVGKYEENNCCCQVEGGVCEVWFEVVFGVEVVECCVQVVG